MKIKLLMAAISSTVVLIGTAVPSMASSLSDLDGKAFLFHPKTKEFLGIISSDRYDNDSICNRYGNYGSKYSSLSVLYRYGDYGSRYSNLSAYNPRAQYPPVIFLSNGEAVAVVTTNPRWEGVHPAALFGVICGQQ